METVKDQELPQIRGGQSGEPPSEPMVTLVVVMRNEEKHIGCCLESLFKNDFPQSDYEVLVADGMSEDSSRAIVQSKAERFPQLRLIENPGKIVPTGLNLAIRQARGRYIFILGAHSEYPPNYISGCICEFERTGATVVGGRLKTNPGADSLVARAIALITQHRFGVGNSSFRLGGESRFVDTVPFGAYKREVFEQVGLFNEELVRSQDFEFNARIRAAGGKIFMTSAIEINYYNVATLRQFARQGFSKGMFVGKSWVQSRASFSWRHAAPLVLVLSLLLSLAVGYSSRLGLYFGMALFTTYLLAALGASAQIAARNGLAYFLISPIIFLAYHWSYGMGTLWSLLTAFFHTDSSASSAAR